MPRGWGTRTSHAGWRGPGPHPTLRDRSGGWTALDDHAKPPRKPPRLASTDEPSAKAASLHMKALASVEIARRSYGELVDLLSGPAMERGASRPVAAQGVPSARP